MADTAAPQGRTWLDACTVPTGSVAGIPVRLHLLFGVVLALGMVSGVGRGRIEPLPWAWKDGEALSSGPPRPVRSHARARARPTPPTPQVGQIGRPWQYFVWAAIVYGPLLLGKKEADEREWGPLGVGCTPPSFPTNHLLPLPGTVLVHELGHCVATRRLGAPVHGILLWPLGGLAFVGHTASPRDDLLVAAAGPLTHLPQVAFWIVLELITTVIMTKRAFLTWNTWPPSNNLWFAVVTAAVSLNVALFAFNLLLPVYPLDGGRVLADALLMCGVPVRTAAFIVGGVGAALGVAIIIYGFMRGLGGILVVAIGVWALFSTAEIVAAAVRGDAASHPLFCFENGQQQAAQQQQQAPAWPPQAAPPPGANPFVASRV